MILRPLYINDILRIRGMQTTMKLSKETVQRIRDHGRMGDTLESVVNQVLDKVENKEKPDVV